MCSTIWQRLGRAHTAPRVVSCLNLAVNTMKNFSELSISGRTYRPLLAWHLSNLFELYVMRSVRCLLSSLCIPAVPQFLAIRSPSRALYANAARGQG